MSALCPIFAWLAIGAALLYAIAAGRVALDNARLAALGRFFCRCHAAVIAALLGGVLLGIWVCSCAPAVAAALGKSGYGTLALLALLLLVGVLSAWVLCGLKAPDVTVDPKKPTHAPKGVTITLRVAVGLAIASILALLNKCCGGLGHALSADRCARLFGSLVLAWVLVVLVWAVARRHCDCNKAKPCPERILEIIALVSATLAAALIELVCHQSHEKPFDLAMVGVWWEGAYDGESGAHLRWAFRSGLAFPENGFDLYRRPSSGGSWTTINAEPIRPATVFEDGNPAPGPMWQSRAVDRLHPSRWDHFRTPFLEMRALLDEPPFASRYYVHPPPEGLPAPALFYDNDDLIKSYLEEYRTAARAGGAEAPPLAQWRTKPIQTLLLAALHPDAARLLGLLYIDKEAQPDTEYDYRIVGHWTDNERSYIVERLSRPRTAALNVTHLTRGESPVNYVTLSGAAASHDRVVGLRWDPPTADPAATMLASDGIRPLRYAISRKFLGPSPCPTPPVPEDPAFAPLKRMGEGGVEEEVAPLAVSPTKTVSGWKWPDFFFTDSGVDYGCYAYLIRGIDLFGRISVASNVLVANVQDFTAPPAPMNVEAKVFQRDDPHLDPEGTGYFATRPTTTRIAVRISWVWPNDFLTSVPDTRAFKVFYRVSNYATFVQLGDAGVPPLWTAPSNWEGSSAEIALTTGQALPARLVGLVTNAQYFETVLYDVPLSPNDDRPVAYAYVGVSSIDHSPYDNLGAPSPPLLIAAPDRVAPDPPAIPVIVEGPTPVDRGANALVKLAIGADSRYSYHLMHLPTTQLDKLTDVLSGTAPACLGAAPTCTTTDLVCTGLKRDFRWRWLALLHPEFLGTVTMAPERPKGPDSGPASFLAEDRVDATVGSYYLYAARAIDPAGNVSPIGCSTVVQIRDGMAPRPPTVSEIAGAESTIRIRWTANTEDDLAKYRLYRTASRELDGSSDRMTLVLESDSAGVALAPTGAAPATRASLGTSLATFTWIDPAVTAGRDYWYRLVAVDQSENISALSDSAMARAFDTTPPGPATWGSPPVTRVSDSTGSYVELHISRPATETQIRYRFQRRESNKRLWRNLGDWSTTTEATISFQDKTVSSGLNYAYRVQLSDPTGNIGGFSDEQLTP